MDSVHLIGAEDVARAGSSMQSAAETMSRAAVSLEETMTRTATLLEESLARHRQFLNDYLAHFEAVLIRNHYRTEPAYRPERPY